MKSWYDTEMLIWYDGISFMRSVSEMLIWYDGMLLIGFWVVRGVWSVAVLNIPLVLNRVLNFPCPLSLSELDRPSLMVSFTITHVLMKLDCAFINNCKLFLQKINENWELSFSKVSPTFTLLTFWKHWRKRVTTISCYLLLFWVQTLRPAPQQSLFAFFVCL